MQVWVYVIKFQDFLRTHYRILKFQYFPRSSRPYCKFQWLSRTVRTLKFIHTNASSFDFFQNRQFVICSSRKKAKEVGKHIQIDYTGMLVIVLLAEEKEPLHEIKNCFDAHWDYENKTFVSFHWHFNRLFI